MCQGVGRNNVPLGAIMLKQVNCMNRKLFVEFFTAIFIPCLFKVLCCKIAIGDGHMGGEFCIYRLNKMRRDAPEAIYELLLQ